MKEPGAAQTESRHSSALTAALSPRARGLPRLLNLNFTEWPQAEASELPVGWGVEQTALLGTRR